METRSTAMCADTASYKPLVDSGVWVMPSLPVRWAHLTSSSFLPVCGYMSHTDCKKDASADCVVPFLSQTQTAPIAEKEGNQEASVCDEAMPAYLPPAKELDEQILDGDEPKHEREFIWPHHWVEGNLAAGVVCTFCSKPINPGPTSPHQKKDTCSHEAKHLCREQDGGLQMLLVRLYGKQT